MAKDPKAMTDEELEAAIATPEEPEAPKVEPPVEEPPKEEPAPPAPAVEEAVEELEEVEEEEEKPPSRREQLRIQDVLAKLKAKEAATATPTPVTPDALDYEKTLDADPELIAKLKADREATNKAMFDRGIEQAKSIQFHTRLEIDAPRVETKYPQLDKSSAEFHPVLANAINSMFLSAAGYSPGDPAKGIADSVQNPDLRYADYVESIFELANEIAGEKTAESKKNIVKQAAQTGLRPDGSGAKRMNLNQSPNAMSDEELEAKIQSDFKALGLA